LPKRKLEPSRINIKPLSVNRCWQGRRFKTSEYKSYETDIVGLLPSEIDIPEGLLQINIVWGFSTTLSDIDNPIKPFQDILQMYYKFNDRDVYKLVIEKKIVKKGEEYIEFLIEDYDTTH